MISNRYRQINNFNAITVISSIIFKFTSPPPPILARPVPRKNLLFFSRHRPAVITATTGFTEGRRCLVAARVRRTPYTYNDDVMVFVSATDYGDRVTDLKQARAYTSRHRVWNAFGIFFFLSIPIRFTPILYLLCSCCFVWPFTRVVGKIKRSYRFVCIY